MVFTRTSSHEDVKLVPLKKDIPSVGNLKKNKVRSQKKRKLRTYVGLPSQKKTKQKPSLGTEELNISSYFTRRAHSVCTDTKTDGKVFSTIGMYQCTQEPAHRKAKPANDQNY